MAASARPVPPRQEPDLTRCADPDLEDGARFEDVEITGSPAGVVAHDVEIAGSRLTAARLSGIELGGFRLVDAVVEDCELSGALLGEASIERVAFRGCRLSGTVLVGAQLRNVSFVDCKLDGVVLRMATGHRVWFEDSVLSDADLHGMRITDARFFDCDLQRADVTDADLRGARFHGSRLDDLHGALGLRGATVDPGQVLTLSLPLCRASGIAVAEERDPPEPAAGRSSPVSRRR
jgi:uncharacterized protein YjbI with pentapeptide repeats